MLFFDFDGRLENIKETSNASTQLKSEIIIFSTFHFADRFTEDVLTEC